MCRDDGHNVGFCIDNQRYKFRKLFGPDTVSGRENGTDPVWVPSQVLRDLSATAFRDLSFYLRPSHLDALADVLRDPGSGCNERFVCSALIKNAVVAGEELFPLCQDTGTATVLAWKGHRVRTEGGDEACIAGGIGDTYRSCNLRYSQLAPVSMFKEKNTGSNMPAQVDIYATKGDEYHFLFIAKGAGSSNKTVFFQETRALLFPDTLEEFLRRQIGALGADACPPYHIAVVIGGASPEQNLKTQKLATTGWLDGLPGSGDERGRAFRDLCWEGKVLKMAAETGIGAQFGGRHMALAARVIRLPRHAGSCPVSVGVSCSAHRNIAGKISREGVFLEKLDKNPSRLLDVLNEGGESDADNRVDLNRPMEEILSQLKGLEPGTLVVLNGALVVARDLAHARIFEALRNGGEMPAYMKKYPVCYAGPAKTPQGKVVGSFGPTTSKRMDGYLAAFMKEGASLVSVGKGSRSKTASRACRQYGGFYLGTIGGAAALMAEQYITSCKIIDFEEFGMEAVHLIGVENFPAFVLCNEKGESFYGALFKGESKLSQAPSLPSRRGSPNSP